MTRYEKYRQLCREAGFTGLSAVVLVLFWLAAGFGLADVKESFFGLPLWVWTSTVGVWVLAMLLVHFLCSRVFAEMSLEDDDHE